MKIDKVIVIGESQTENLLQVLSIDMLGKNPAIMKPYGARYAWATALYNYAGVGLCLVSIAASFFVKWWIFIPGCYLGNIVLGATRQSTADFAVEILQQHPTSFTFLASQGVIWQAPPDSVVPA